MLYKFFVFVCLLYNFNVFSQDINIKNNENNYFSNLCYEKYMNLHLTSRHTGVTRYNDMFGKYNENNIGFGVGCNLSKYLDIKKFAYNVEAGIFKNSYNLNSPYVALVLNKEVNLSILENIGIKIIMAGNYDISDKSKWSEKYNKYMTFQTKKMIIGVMVLC